MTQLYLAYGSNMNPEQMAFRCPGARNLGPFKIANWRLVFRMVADIEAKQGAEVQGILWELTEADEQALDDFEGVANDTYTKEYFTVTTPEGERQVLVYLMTSTGIFPPTEAYYRRIVAGYKAAGLKLKPLREAKDHAWDERNPSHKERQRYARAGRPMLAERSEISPAEIALRQDQVRRDPCLTDAREAARQLAGEKPAGKKKRKVQKDAEVSWDNVDDLFREPRKRDARPSPPRKNLVDWLEERRQSGRGY